MMSILVEQLINITDAVFLGHVGETELGASAIAAIYYLAVYMLGFGFSIGMQVMVARKHGEQNYPQTGKIFFQGLFFLCALAVVLCLLMHAVSPFMLKPLITSPEIYEAVTRYLYWRSFGLLFSFPLLAVRSFLIGITHTGALLCSALLAVSVNIPLNYLFIFYFDTGISGAAIASSIAEIGPLIVLTAYMCRKTVRKKYNLKPVYDGRLMAALLRLSVWSMLHAFISVAPWFLFFISIQHIGTAELAISNITRSVSTLFFVIVNSFAVTSGSLVSNLIGAGNRNGLFPLCRKILRLGYATGLPLVALALFSHHSVIGFYTGNPLLMDAAAIPFAVMLLNYIFALPGYVYLNALGGTGNTRMTFIFQVIATAVYLLYLYLLSCCTKASLAVYLTAEYLFVILLAIQSVIYLKIKHY